MKQLLLLSLLVLGLSACMSTQKVSGDPMLQERIDRTADSLNSGHFTISFNYVIPRRMSPHALTTDYYVKVQGDTIVSFLPFFGVAYRADFGSDRRSALDFTGRILDYAVRRKKKDRFEVLLKTRKDMELMFYHFEIFSNGRASLDVTPTDREPISFSGDMQIESDR